jgi:hypothetical protein
MLKAPNYNESYMIEACKAAKHKKKLNILKIACKYSVPHQTLQDHIKTTSQAYTAQKLVNKVLEGYQEEALIH